MNDAPTTTGEPTAPDGKKAYLADNVVTSGQMYAWALNAGTCEVSDASRNAIKGLVTRHPILKEVPQNSRIFVRRAARYLANNGILQFLDLGSGLPTDTNTHEVVQDIEPQARVVYVDNDPMTALQASDMIVASGARNVAFVNADVVDMAAIINHPETQRLIDFTQPIGLMMCSIMHLVPEHHAQDVAGMSTHELVRAWVDKLPSGSYLAFEQFSRDHADQAEADAINEAVPGGMHFRPVDEIRRYFDGLDLVSPNFRDPEDATAPDVGWSNRWGSPDPTQAHHTGAWLWAGVAKKP